MWIWCSLAIIGVIVMILYYGLLFLQQRNINKLVNPYKDDSLNSSQNSKAAENKYSDMKHISETEYDEESDRERYYSNNYQPSSTNNPSVYFKNTVIDCFGPIVKIDSLDFIALFSISENGEWLVGWEDSYKYEDSIIQGSRNDGNGRIILCNMFDQTVEFANVDLQRPICAKVSNNGLICVIDILFTSDLLSKLYIFDKTGTKLKEHSIQANLINLEVSRSGYYVIFQAANSNTDDSGKLSLLDIMNNKILFSTSDTYGRASDYNIDELGQLVYVKLPNHETQYRYSFSGEKLDINKMKQNILTSNDYDLIISFVEESFKDKKISKEDIELILTHLVRIEPFITKEWKDLLPKLFKLKGIGYEILGNKNEAISEYQKAINLNPKIGVKRRLLALQKNSH